MQAIMAAESAPVPRNSTLVPSANLSIGVPRAMQVLQTCCFMRWSIFRSGPDEGARNCDLVVSNYFARASA